MIKAIQPGCTRVRVYNQGGAWLTTSSSEQFKEVRISSFYPLGSIANSVHGPSDAGDAGLVGEVEIILVQTLVDPVTHLSGGAPIAPNGTGAAPRTSLYIGIDFSEVNGQEHVRPESETVSVNFDRGCPRSHSRTSPSRRKSGA